MGARLPRPPADAADETDEEGLDGAPAGELEPFASQFARVMPDPVVTDLALPEDAPSQDGYAERWWRKTLQTYFKHRHRRYVLGPAGWGLGPADRPRRKRRSPLAVREARKKKRALVLDAVAADLNSQRLGI